jgi:peptidyl-prolyl cis-trans isomerase B (cyclophilin B)
MHKDASYLDGQYAAFGKVVKGIEVVDKIAGVPTSRWNNRPYEDQVIDTIRIVEE